MVATAASDRQYATYRLSGTLADCTENDNAAPARKPWENPTADLVDELEDLIYNHSRWLLHADDITERLQSIRVLVSGLTRVEVRSQGMAPLASPMSRTPSPEPFSLH